MDDVVSDYESPPFDPDGDPYSESEEAALGADIIAYLEGRTPKTARLLASDERVRKARDEYRQWLSDQRSTTTP